MRSKQVVLDAAISLLVKKGWSGFSINEIVRKTGVAKTTIYRHWSTQSHLLFDVMAYLSAKFEMPDTGSLRQDLIELYRSSVAVSADRALQTLPGLMERAQHEPALKHMIDFLGSRAFDIVRILLERARARGEVRRDREVETMTYVLLGALNASRLFLNKSMTDDELVDVVDILLVGIALAAPRTRGRGE